MPKALPVRRWQARQLQIETANGSPSTSRRSCPQWQAASRVATAAEPTEPHDARVRMWVRRDAYEDGLDPVVEAAMREWLERDWPFERVDWADRAD
jgi:hypothetical protein